MRSANSSSCASKSGHNPTGTPQIGHFGVIFALHHTIRFRHMSQTLLQGRVGLPMTGPISFSDITVGMQVTATTTWTATNATSATSATVVAVDANGVTLSTGDTIPAPIWVDPTTTVTYNLDSAAPTPPPPAPPLGIIYLDESSNAWQATGTTETLVMLCIDGTSLDWAEFGGTHPAATAMQDVPVVPLPDPVSPYPQAITPDQARLGMDIRVTATYADGDHKVVRGICVWNQDNGADKTDDIPDYLALSLSTGDVWQYNPVPDGQTLLVEQMQDWTADSVWDISGIPEPPTGSIVRSKTGIAWQRTGDATADGDWYKTGDGLWSSVTGDFPRSFLWLWGAAAPFHVQEESA